MSLASHSSSRCCDSATNRREAADFDVPSPSTRGSGPSGSRTARPILRVATPISIRFMAVLPSQSSVAAAVQLGNGIWQAQTSFVGNTAMTTYSPAMAHNYVKPGQDTYIRVFTIPPGQRAPQGLLSADEVMSSL